MEREILIFLRAAELGKVKTRLAAGLGQDKTLDIYLSLIKTTLDVCEQVTALRSLYFYPRIDHASLRPSFTPFLQKGENLGAKMSHAFKEAFIRSKSVLIIGTDCPYITPALIEKAFKLLEKSDLVIGPAEDGGYYLLGMNRLHASLFENMPWSSEKVCEMTLKQASILGLVTETLPVLSDIDYQADWERYLESKK